MSFISYSNSFIGKKPSKKKKFKNIFKIVLVIILLIFSVGGIAQLLINSSNSKKLVFNNKYVSIDNKKFYYSLNGKESPTIIFESNSGMGIDEWNKTREVIEEEYGLKTFAYDRAGFGMSDFSETLTPEEQAKKLKLILRKVALSGPYIFVGNGYGSTIVTNFAKLYPELVEGVILISPINEEYLGNNKYYNSFKKDKLKKKFEVYGSYLGVNSLIDKYIGLNKPKNLEKYLSEEDYNNYNMLRGSSKFNKACYGELENILNKSSNSQEKGMFKNIPYVLITTENNKEAQLKLKELGSENLTKVIDSNIDSEIIPLEKPELLLESVKYIINNNLDKKSLNS